MTASRWLPPLRVLTPPVDHAEFMRALDRGLAQMGRLCILPADCKFDVIEAGSPRPLRARTSLGLLRSERAKREDGEGE